MLGILRGSQQLHLAHVQVAQDLGADAVGAQAVAVGAGRLGRGLGAVPAGDLAEQVLGRGLAVHQHQHAGRRGGDRRQRVGHAPAVRADAGVQHVQHRGRLVHAHQGFSVGVDRAVHQGQVGRARGGVLVGHRVELAPGGLHAAPSQALDDGFMLAAVLDQVGDGADLELVLAGELHQVGQARHGAVGLEDLADHGGGRQAGHGGQVAAGLGVAGAHQHAAGHRAHREDVAGLHQVGRLGVARHRNLDGAGAVGGRDAGLDALGGLDRLGEIGAVSRAVAGGHQRQVQLAAALFGQRQADQAAPVRDHEVDGFGRDELGGHDQVALVLAVFLIDQDDDAAGAQLGDDLGDRGDAVGFRLGIGQGGQLDGHGLDANQAGKSGFYRPGGRGLRLNSRPKPSPENQGKTPCKPLRPCLPPSRPPSASC